MLSMEVTPDRVKHWSVQPWKTFATVTRVLWSMVRIVKKWDCGLVLWNRFPYECSCGARRVNYALAIDLLTIMELSMATFGSSIFCRRCSPAIDPTHSVRFCLLILVQELWGCRCKQGDCFPRNWQTEHNSIQVFHWSDFYVIFLTKKKKVPVIVLKNERLCVVSQFSVSLWMRSDCTLRKSVEKGNSKTKIKKKQWL